MLIMRRKVHSQAVFLTHTAGAFLFSATPPHLDPILNIPKMFSFFPLRQGFSVCRPGWQSHSGHFADQAGLKLERPACPQSAGTKERGAQPLQAPKALSTS